MPLLDVDPRQDFHAVAGAYRASRAQGGTVRSLVDCLIAAVAVRHEATLVHRDDDFEALAASCQGCGPCRCGERVDRTCPHAEPPLREDDGVTHPPDAMPALHEGLAPLAFLVGSWHGFGAGVYPTIKDFRYEQELDFGHDGRPFLQYTSRSWIVDDDGRRVRPAAREAGWWRIGGSAREVEVTMSQPTGIVEVYLGEVVFHKVELATDVVARTASAKEVTALKRLYGLVPAERGDGHDLAYAIDLAAVGQSLQPHLSARLARRS